MATVPSNPALAGAAPRRGRRLVSWLFGLVALSALVGSIWYAYDRGLKRAAAPPPLIHAEPGPTKMRPADPGGLKVPYQAETIYREVERRNERPRESSGAERLLPPPEQPMAKPKPPELTPPPVASPPEVPTAEAAPPVAAAPAPAVPAIPTPQAAAPAVEPPSPAAAAAEPPAIAPSATTPVAAPPLPTPQPVVSAPPVASPAAPLAIAPPSSPAAPPPAAQANKPVPVTALSSGGVRIQLGALPDQASADKAWKRYKAANADVLGNASPTVTTFTPEGKATVYRLQAGPFADLASAKHACETLRSRRVDCIVRP